MGSACDDEAFELEDIRRTSHLNIDTNHKNSAGERSKGKTGPIVDVVSAFALVFVFGGGRE